MSFLIIVFKPSQKDTTKLKLIQRQLPDD